jgi:NAD(P)-dependent dehydrogenase (short-subunit alcohol dehydrogenase family)
MGFRRSLVRIQSPRHHARAVGTTGSGGPPFWVRPRFLVVLHGLLHGYGLEGGNPKVREIVEAVLYLESAAFVTGETLHVDGGAHTGHW